MSEGLFIIVLYLGVCLLAHYLALWIEKNKEKKIPARILVVFEHLYETEDNDPDKGKND